MNMCFWRPYWSVCIGLDDGLVLPGTKPLVPELILTKITDVLWRDLKNVYKLFNLRALKISIVYKNHIFRYIGKTFCVSCGISGGEGELDLVRYFKIGIKKSTFGVRPK